MQRRTQSERESYPAMSEQDKIELSEKAYYGNDAQSVAEYIKACLRGEYGDFDSENNFKLLEKAAGENLTYYCHQLSSNLPVDEKIISIDAMYLLGLLYEKGMIVSEESQESDLVKAAAYYIQTLWYKDGDSYDLANKKFIEFSKNKIKLAALVKANSWLARRLMLRHITEYEFAKETTLKISESVFKLKAKQDGIVTTWITVAVFALYLIYRKIFG